MRAKRTQRETEKAAQNLSQVSDAPFVTQESNHVIVVGYGRVGRRVADSLSAQNIPMVVVESEIERIEELRANGRTAVLGNAVRDDVLKSAGIDRARLLLVAVPNGLEAGEIVAHARKLRGDLRIVARAHLDEEVQHITSSGANRVIMGEHEIAKQMLADAVA